MAIDTSKSFEVEEHGITIDSGTGINISGGDAVPTHTAPEGSRYFRTSPEDMYVQEGPGVASNWVIFEGGGGGDANAAYGSLKQDATVSYDLVANTWTKITSFNLNLSAGGSIIVADHTADRITVGPDGEGFYFISFSLEFLSNTSGQLSGAMYKNGSRINPSLVTVDNSNGQRDHIAGSCLVEFLDTDYLELFIKSTAENQDPDVEFCTLNCIKSSGGTAGAQGPTGPAGPPGVNNIDGGDAAEIYPAANIDGGAA